MEQKAASEMILVTKPVASPARLGLGVALTQTDCAAFDADLAAFANGARSFTFSKAVYGHASVKAPLQKAQHHKCCYCEAKFIEASPGVVEHFRPKADVRQDLGHPIEPPGYYWLAYSWPNLYFSCPNCNRSAKKSFFPLANPAGRARSHNDSINNERPLLLNPGGPADPRNHIRFHGEVAEGTTRAGRKTIEILKLNRPSLLEARLVEANRLRNLKKIVTAYVAAPKPQWPSYAVDAQNALLDAVKPTAVFSAMAQDLIR